MLFCFCNFGSPYSRGVVASEFSAQNLLSCDMFAFEQVVNKFIDIMGCGCYGVGFKMFVSWSYHSLSKTVVILHLSALVTHN